MPTSCLKEHPRMKDVGVKMTYRSWDGTYPAPPGATVSFTCPAGFTDGSYEHYATCSLQPYDAWDASFRDDDELCPAAVYPDCRLSEKGMEYVGKTNVTETGKPCLRWDSERVTSSYKSLDAGFDEVLFFEEHFINLDTSSHENFCRNPTGLARPWCFIDDDGFKMTFCRIPLCNDFSVPECKVSQKGGEYVGVKDKTISGFDCIPWLDVDSGDTDRNYWLLKGSFSDELTDTHNFCRNPNGNPGGPWCNIRDSRKPHLKWEYCDVHFCAFGESEETSVQSGDRYGSKPAECKQTKDGREYSGLKNVTRSGKKCQPWLSQTPNEHSTMLYLPAFPDPDMDGRHNYCRNPDLEKEAPWCYNGEGTNPEWEYCDIQFCEGMN
ncbi:unnamed protein product [Darwinula stevensoni]|uniref:Kringle domain-containing protein n=1 Tax=Darwinula stevensoni TaxID=69355 RepID=A0A7R8XA19_9CRUS|nr:unnamed protein product [Darwinula stevensoni]CAG0891571.1 unnamed protein product [Darwinula stevensoni]